MVEMSGWSESWCRVEAGVKLGARIFFISFDSRYSAQVTPNPEPNRRIFRPSLLYTVVTVMTPSRILHTNNVLPAPLFFSKNDISFAVLK